MTHAYFGDDNQMIPENKTIGQWKQDYAKLLARGRNFEEPSDYAGFAYDAVWTYALALDKLIKENPEAVGDLHSNHTTE